MTKAVLEVVLEEQLMLFFNTHYVHLLILFPAIPPLTKPSIHVKMRKTLSERQGHNVKLEDRK